MGKEELLPLLKAQINKFYIDKDREAQLEHLIDTAIALIGREGAELTAPYSPEDAQLIIMYAAYLFEKRSTEEPMPRMLRWALNNRIIGGPK